MPVSEKTEYDGSKNTYTFLYNSSKIRLFPMKVKSHIKHIEEKTKDEVHCQEESKEIKVTQ